MSAVPTLKLNPWHSRAEDLARWAMVRLVNRTDRCGRYFFDAEAKRAKPYADPPKPEDARMGYLSHERLTRHFRATDTAAVIGSYSYGADRFGKWLNIDIDAHDSTSDPLANEQYAVHVARRAAALGLCVLLYESNGKGGFHLWVLFDGAVVASVLRALGNWLVADAAEFGFAKPPEVFPKNDGETVWGNWVRMIGRHHTRDVWPRVWDGTEWVSGLTAVEYVLSLTGCDPEVIPSEAAVFGIEVESGGSGPRPERPAGVTATWQDFNTRATVADISSLVERHGWTRARSRGDGAVEFVRPGKKVRDGQGGNLLVRDGAPIFFCFTDAAPPLKAMKGYAPAALAAILDHGGDFKKSNERLYDQGYGTRTNDRKKPAPGAKAGQATYTPNIAAAPDDCESELVFTSVAGIEPEAIHFLVPGFIPRGMIGMIAGDGGHGKSMMTLELAAALSVGRCAFGLSYADPPKGKTLLISCEDDWQRTIVPRLAALGADRNNILRVEGVRMKAGGKVMDFHMGHYAQLERALVANPDIKLIVIDPAGAYIGRAGVNENQDSELRAVLGPLSELANRNGALALLVKHLNKSAGVSAVQRVGGSAGYINAVRFAFMVAPDPDDQDKKLVLPIKANVLPSRTAGLAYRMQPLPSEEATAVLLREWPNMKPGKVADLAKQLFRQAWEGPISADADTVAGTKQSKRPLKQEDVATCGDFIRKFLGSFCWPEKELEEAAKKAGFSFNVYVEAKKSLRADDRTDATRLSSKAFTRGGAWWTWIGPQGDPSPARPAPQTYKTRESKETCETYETCHSGCTGDAGDDDSKFANSPESHKSPKGCSVERKPEDTPSAGDGGEL